ncbi:hypothetical protein [Mesotoga sp.]|uniref:hypothetical protein n=1 Tax=Mesotoga sp. TaxID=2053577 RepID=UPI00345E5C48
MWSCQRNRRKGFALVATLSLVAFGTIILLATGSQLSRTTDVLASYKAISRVQNIASNAVEVGSHFFLKDHGQFQSRWPGINDFKNSISSRAGAESALWLDYVSSINETTSCLDLSSEVNYYSGDAGLGSNEYSIECYVFSVGARYITIASAEKNGIKRYSLGVISRVGIAQGGLPALRLGTLDRVLKKMNAGPGNSGITGDIVFGSAIILDDPLTLSLTSQATPGDVVIGTLTSPEVVLSFTGTNPGEETIEQWLESWLVQTDKTRQDYLNEWYEDYLASFPTEVTEIRYSMDDTNGAGNSYVLPAEYVGDEYVVHVDPPTGHEADMRQFIAKFSTSGLVISYGDNKLTIPSSIVQNEAVHLVINGDTRFENDENHPHKVALVNGKYDIKVLGNVDIATNLAYPSLLGYINNGNSDNNIVANLPKEVNSEIATNMVSDYQNPEKNTSWLRLAAVGGDMDMYFQRNNNSANSAHGVKFLMGDFFAFSVGGEGGDVGFVDNSNPSTNVRTPQFFVFGSLTSETFDSEDRIEEIASMVAVANEGNEADGSPSSFFSTRLALLGIQSW